MWNNISFTFLCIVTVVLTIYIFKKAILRSLKFKEHKNKDKFIALVFENEKKLSRISKNPLWYFLVLLVLYLALGAGLFYAANRIIDNYKLTFDFSALMTVFISSLVVIFILMFVVYFFLTTWLLIRNKTRVKKFNKKHNQKLLNYKTIANDQKITSIQKFWKIVLYFQKHFSIELITWLAYSDATLLFVLLNNYQWWIKFIFILAATSSVFITIFLRRNTFYLKYKDPKIIVNGKVQPKNKTKK